MTMIMTTTMMIMRVTITPCGMKKELMMPMHMLTKIYKTLMMIETTCLMKTKVCMMIEKMNNQRNLKLSIMSST
jgi:hypothetical protein